MDGKPRLHHSRAVTESEGKAFAESAVPIEFMQTTLGGPCMARSRPLYLPLIRSIRFAFRRCNSSRDALLRDGKLPSLTKMI